ncbi:MAG TPA: glycosyltransferase family 39 protein, partial [Polyangiaceae bacterium]
PSLARADVVGEFLHVPYMTGIAIVARLVTAAMSLGVVWAIAKMAEEVRGRRAGWFAAAFVGVNVPFTYYAHTTNLDVPYLFWSCLALLALARAIVRHEPRRFRTWGVLAALAIGTKDQAYALFLLGAPAALLAWVALDPWARRNARRVALESTVALGLGAGVLAVVDGVVFNPTGFLARVRFLLGPASQSYAVFTADWAGRWQVVRDLVARFNLFYPLAFAALVLVGLVVIARGGRREGAHLAAALVPLLAAISYTVAFNCMARRADQRFELPQMVLLGVYGGIGIDALVFGAARPPVRWLLRLLVAAAFAVAVFAAVDVDANLLLDPRYDAESWLKAHAAPGDLVETYGQNVYMPRFPRDLRVERVGPAESDHRNPMPGVEEVRAPFGEVDARAPRFIVVSQGWVWRYLIDPDEAQDPGRMLAPTQRETSSDAAATAYFHALVDGRNPSYALAHVARWTSST